MNLEKLSEVEANRFEEIQFYLHIRHIFSVCGEQQATYELIETLCRIADTSITMIKTLTANINAINSPVRPDKRELIIMLCRSGATIRSVAKNAQTSERTIYRYLEQYENEQFKEFYPRIKEDFIPHIKKFNNLIKELMPHDGYILPR
mgnify:CR=1 FL=1